MAKIMLVEDDNNLREIYEARLLAEGYEIVSAEDGEQALAMAVKEKPDLIISDIMMPKISGFDMLDILRSTPETKNTKVIMMTALSQAEDKARADKLGADRYLVKSQVTLEDVAKVAREVLQDEDTVPAGKSADTAAPAATDSPSQPQPAAQATVAPQPVQQAPAPAPATPPVEPAAAAMPVAESPAASGTASRPVIAPAPRPVVPAPVSSTSAPPQKVDPSLADTAAKEEATVEKQIDSFVKSAPQPTPASTPTQAAPDPTNAAADNAAKMANAANDLLRHGDTPKPKPATTTTNDHPNSGKIAGKKIIKPINDITTEDSKPSLNDLLAKEAEKSAVEPAPTTSVVSPGGQTVTPAAPGGAPSATQPGNVVQGGTDPNSIAL